VMWPPLHRSGPTRDQRGDHRDCAWPLRHAVGNDGVPSATQRSPRRWQ
jgi:hypothetical protein